MISSQKHISVLYEELIWSLRFFDKGRNVILDATLWLWWHAAWVIEKLWRWDIFIGLDCDETNLQSATQKLYQLLQEKSISEQPLIYTIQGNFRDVRSIIKNIHTYRPINEIEGVKSLPLFSLIYADLGVSSVHFDTAERGFSFRFEGPLDMRLDIQSPITAKTLIASLEYEKMAEMLRVYGDEPKAGYITKKILEARKKWSIETTQDLAHIITPISRDALPRVFQALRIAVNDEFWALKALLEASHDLLVKWWRLSIISFHSWEDRIVKHFLKEKSTPEKDTITGQDIHNETLRIITKKPITPSEEEVQKNSRARSALLRVAEKI